METYLEKFKKENENETTMIRHENDMPLDNSPSIGISANDIVSLDNTIEVSMHLNVDPFGNTESKDISTQVNVVSNNNAESIDFSTHVNVPFETEVNKKSNLLLDI